jgi:hypothetical protein
LRAVILIHGSLTNDEVDRLETHLLVAFSL